MVTEMEGEKYKLLLSGADVPGSVEALKNAGNWKEAQGLDAICRRAAAAVRARGNYRQMKSHQVKLLWCGKFFVNGLRFKDWSAVFIGLANPRRWESVVEAQGMEIIEGRFVLAVITRRDKDDADVLLAEQGQRMSVWPAVARVRRLGSGGEWFIEGKPNRKHPAVAELCWPLAKGETPDDPMWQAALYVYMMQNSSVAEKNR